MANGSPNSPRCSSNCASHAKILSFICGLTSAISLATSCASRKRPATASSWKCSASAAQNPAAWNFCSPIPRAPPDALPASSFAPGSRASSLKNSSSGSYVRGIMHEGSHAWALLAAAPSEDSSTIDNILAFGILWLDWTRTRAERRAIEGLRFFVPQGTCQRLREPLLALSASTRVEIYEMLDPDSAMQKIDPADAGNLESWLVPRDQIESALRAASATIARIHRIRRSCKT